MRKKYCCDASQQLFNQYYGQQQRGNGNFPVYVGRLKQKGHGIGSIISGLFKQALPILKTMAPIVLRTGANIVEDVSRGEAFKDSASKHILGSRKRKNSDDLSSDVFNKHNQSGSGVRRSKTLKQRKRGVRRIRKSKKRKCGLKSDIFS